MQTVYLLLIATITAGKASVENICQKMDSAHNVTSYTELQSSTISINQPVGHQQCVRSCGRHKACKAIAYDPATLTCVLRRTPNTTETLHNTKTSHGACFNHTCNLYQQCIILSNGGRFCAGLAFKAGNLVLMNGSAPSEGRVEIFYEGRWGKVDASTYWGDNIAIVICRQFNYNFGISVIDLPFGVGINPFVLDRVNCSGDEETLLQCSHRMPSPFIRNNYAGGVICSDTTFGEEISAPVRLAHGRTPFNGIVEIFYAGYWGTVAYNDQFDNNDARVICKELNFTGETVISSAHYVNYTHTIVWKSHPYCGGNEPNFSACRSGYSLGTYQYTTGLDAAVVCDDPTKSSINDPVRLVNGNFSSQGRVEILHSSFWGTICQQGWDDLDALVVCRQLGYSNGIAVFQKVFGKANSSLVTWLDNVQCNGTEHRLGMCPSDSWGVTSCQEHNHDTGVICNGNYTNTITLGTLRLVNGNSELDGRVEINIFGEWSNVDGINWDHKEAQVACRQLGYTEGAPILNTYFKSWPVYLEKMSCSGSELRLIDCPRSGYHSHSDLNAGVVCTGNIASDMEGQIRLRNGRRNQEGRVEVYHAGYWGSIWEDRSNTPWSKENVRVVCKQLGYSDGQAVHGSFFGFDEVVVWMMNVKCKGYEEGISNCPFRGWGDQYLYKPYISYYRGIGVVCDSDDKPSYYGDIRLVEGSDAYSGRVEIYGPSGFVAFCDRYFDNKIGIVICRQLGLRYAVRSNSTSYGSSSRVAWMQYISCLGNEERLEHCSFKGWIIVPKCYDGQQLGIVCKP